MIYKVNMVSLDMVKIDVIRLHVICIDMITIDRIGIDIARLPCGQLVSPVTIIGLFLLPLRCCQYSTVQRLDLNASPQISRCRDADVVLS